MKKFILLIALFPSITCINAQNPGNVGTTNLTAWFKPDALTIGNVTSWTTTFPTGGSATTVTDASSPYPIATNTPAGDVSNYNTTIEFTSNTLTNLKALQNTASPNFLNNLNAADQGTFFCAYLFPTSASNDHLVLYNESSLDAIQLRNLGTSGRMAIGLNGNSSNGARNWTEGFVPSIISYKGNKSGASTMNMYDRSFESLTSTGSGSTGPTGLYFGVKPGVGTSPLNGYLHEVIFYNTNLTTLEIVKVNTYLAIKYGATLLNSGGGPQGDYAATNATTIWDADNGSAYHNNVIGIGRDDSQGLLQKQSHSYNDTTRIYLNTLVATNVANGGAFANDISYVTIGENQGGMCANPIINTEIPGTCGLNSRLEREWKVTKTNITENINLDLTLNTCANPTLVNISELRFLVDDDGDFSNGGTTCYFNGDGTGIVISYSNPVITISGIATTHIANNSTKYITIASILSTTPLPVEMTAFDAACNDETPVLRWTTASETNNAYFTVERSSDAVNYMSVGTLDGNGNSSTPVTYNWVDENPLNGTTYYRLKQTDFNGRHGYHGIVSVNCNKARDISVYPNPFENSFTLQLSENITYPINVVVQDYLGRKVHSQIIEKNTTKIVLDEALPTGTYFVKVFNESIQVIDRLVKMK